MRGWITMMALSLSLPAAASEACKKVKIEADEFKPGVEKTIIQKVGGFSNVGMELRREGASVSMASCTWSRACGTA